MQWILDYIPIVLFFLTFKLYGLYWATGVAILASFIQVTWLWIATRELKKGPLITFVVILLLGGATLILHNPLFIKWKPSVVYWIFAGILLISQYLEKPLLKRFLAEKITLPETAWNRLTISWGIYFLVLGLINVWVAYQYSTETWVNFKLFGTLGMTLCFVFAQITYLSRFHPLSESTDA